MGKGVDAECGLLDEEDAEDATVDEAPKPVTPTDTTDEHGENKAHEENNLEVVAMLPDNDWIFVQVGNVCAADTLGILLHQHPSEVGIEETLADRVRVFVGIGVSMVSTMVTSPPSDGAFDGATTNSCQKDAERKGCGVGSMCPQSMIAFIELLAAGVAGR